MSSTLASLAPTVVPLDEASIAGAARFLTEFHRAPGADLAGRYGEAYRERLAETVESRAPLRD